MNSEALFSLGLYFVAMMAIGYYAYKKSTDDVSGYMLGGRQLHPAVASLSAGASDMSGWMLMGLPGAVYIAGLSSVWIAVGLVVGAYANYKFVAPRLRVYTELADDAITIPDYFEKRFHDTSRTLRIISSVVIVIFFTLYTSAGLVAGGKLFDASFGLDYRTGLALTAGVVVAYTLFGGFLAVSLTDFVQGCIMFIALIMVPIITFVELGNWETAKSVMQGVDMQYLNAFNEMTTVGLLSSLAWGLGYFGQPHIIVRFMAIRTLGDVSTARHIGMSWMVITVIGAVTTGMLGLAYVSTTDVALADPETVFIRLSQVLFHPLIGGFLLAAILAAIMSTISSQLLVSSSSLTEDFYKTFFRREASQKELVLVGRVSVFAVAVIAGVLALDRSNSILSLVSNAWAGFGAAFGPLILLSLYWKRMTRAGAIAVMVTGAVVVLIWLYAPFTIAGQAPSEFIYEMIPGVLASTLAGIAVSLIGNSPRTKVAEQYSQMEQALEAG